MNIREYVIITRNIVLILKKKGQTSQSNKIGELIIYVIFRGNGKATIISVYLEEGQNRNHLAWLDIGDDLVNQVDGDDPEDTEDHDV